MSGTSDQNHSQVSKTAEIGIILRKKISSLIFIFSKSHKRGRICKFKHYLHFSTKFSDIFGFVNYFIIVTFLINFNICRPRLSFPQLIF